MAQRSNHYDALILGSGLSGLLLAKVLKTKGLSVRIFESIQVGGLCQPQSFKDRFINLGLKRIPVTLASDDLLKKLELWLGHPVSVEKKHGHPQTFSKNQFSPFVGFGDNPPEFEVEVRPYVSPEFYELCEQPYQWIQKLSEELQNEIVKPAQVTQVLIENEVAQGFVINQSQTYLGRQIFLTGSLKPLVPLLSDATWGHKNLQKISRSASWGSISVDLIHSEPLPAQDSLYVLSGSGENAFPSWGIIQGDTSQWMTLLAEESLISDDTVATCLREMKRQIKRAFPSAFDNLLFEKIRLLPHSHGKVDLKLAETGELPHAKNLFLASHQLHSEPNLLGCIQTVEASLEWAIKQLPTDNFIAGDNPLCYPETQI